MSARTIMKGRWRVAIAGSVGLVAYPSGAEAHLVTTGLGPIYDGLLHFALSPEDLVPALALSLLAGLRGTVQQTGFDPANPRVATPPPPPPQAPEGGLLRGAFGGAALGGVGGAIGGNAGEGAAIGAGVGALFGAMRRARSLEEQQQMQMSYAAQQQGALTQGRANYNRAFGACMAGRGYTVQ